MDAEEYVSAGAARTARWRASIKQRSIPETDDLDTAIATAFSAFIGLYQRSELLEHQQAAAGMTSLIVKALQDAGYCGDEAARRAENRLYYLQMGSRYPGASASVRRRWELGPPSEDDSFMDEDPDPLFEGDYDPADEGVYDD
ncbi:hypothetical protein HFO32_22290 [Rhizobium leguminosarum]|uniref:hypothetical protein n=1 Tax=Rhizobium leguminosarum TaxID=384 RepID=UPI001C93AAB1|nr:hypothetical protein [Rhizobium leguminosarum]MBY5684856.1 hypothetical protein [Rhizobium leguminosarum]